jgi:hypothetical protein
VKRVQCPATVFRPIRCRSANGIAATHGHQKDFSVVFQAFIALLEQNHKKSTPVAVATGIFKCGVYGWWNGMGRCRPTSNLLHQAVFDRKFIWMDGCKIILCSA